MRGRRIEELIGEISFVQHLVFLFAGRIISSEQARLLEAVMVAGADHGPRAPSIAAARMAATCGISFNSAVATGINLLGDVHGGAAGDAMRALLDVDATASGSEGLDAAALAHVRTWRASGTAVAGFGHQLHSLDPRRAPLLALCEEAVTSGAIDGRYVRVALAIESALETVVERPLPLNIDGLWAIVCCELDLPPDFAMGAFCLSRGAGIVAHAFEEAEGGVKIKGPCPPGNDLVRYVGEPVAG